MKKLSLLLLITTVFTSAFAQRTSNPEDIFDDLQRGMYENCSIELNNYDELELIVNGEVRATASRYDTRRLKMRSSKIIESGICIKRIVTNPNPSQSNIIYRDMVNMQYENCYILENVQQYTQFYYNGQFSGNYTRQQRGQLMTRIMRLTRDGSCRKTNPRSQRIYNDMVNYNYRNCYILENVFGYSQMYINNQFSGNYTSYQITALHERLITLVANRTCIRY